jgi:hypothetical protein
LATKQHCWGIRRLVVQTTLALSKMMHESSKTETVYDKLNKLNAEIAEGIINLSGGQRDVTHRELNTLREQAYKERSPEAVFTTALFRRYAHVANEYKDSKFSAGSEKKTTLIGDLPNFVYEKDDDNMLVGWQATQTNIFRIRALATLFALLTFAVMSSVPYVTESDFYPEHHFNVSTAPIAYRKSCWLPLLVPYNLEELSI